MKKKPESLENLYFYPQIDSQWCWAAVSSMLIACKGGSIKQCEIVSETAGTQKQTCQNKCGESQPKGGRSESVFVSELYKNLFDFRNGLFRSTKGIIEKDEIAAQFELKNYVAIGTNYEKSAITNVNNLSANFLSIKSTLINNSVVGSDSLHFCLSYGFEYINGLSFLKVFDPENWFTTPIGLHFTHILFHEQASRYFGFLLDKKENANIQTKLNFTCKAMDFDTKSVYASLAINKDILQIVKIYDTQDFNTEIQNNRWDVTIDSRNNEKGEERGVYSIKVVSIDSIKIVFYEMYNNRKMKNELIPMFVIKN